MGLVYDPALDSEVDWVYQYNVSGAQINGVTRASEPLKEQVPYSPNRAGFPFAFAKIYAAANPGKKVLIVPCAVGSTGFTDNRWNVGNDLYNNTIAFSNAAIAANPGSQIKGILWSQGENDAINAMPYATYRSRLTAMIAGFRAGITGASNTPFVSGRMPFNWQAADAPTNAIRQAIVDNIAATSRSAIINLATSSNASFISTVEPVHYNAVGMRAVGQLMYNAFMSIT